MTMRNPPKLLSVKVTLNTVAGYDTTLNMPNKWNARLDVTSQVHSNTVTDDGYYTGRDIVVGDYVTTTTNGRALRIASINSNPAPTTSVVYCTLEDVDHINIYLDAGNSDAAIPSNADGILFEVINNIPVLFPIPAALSTSFNQSFASQLLSRFLVAAGGIGGAAIPEGILTLADIGTLVAALDMGKVPVSQLPVGTNPITNVAPGGDYISSLSVGQSVAPIVEGKIPVEYIPTIQDVFETVNAYNDLFTIINPNTTTYYIVSTENAVYKWTGTSFIRITGEATQVSYSYVSVTDSNITYNAKVKDVISVIADNVTILLPVTIENGDDIIILNSGSGTIIDPNGDSIRNSNLVYNLPDTAYSTYLVYVNGWQFSESNQLVNIYTQQPGADQFGPADYWPVGTVQKMENAYIYSKEAYIESWESTRTQIVTILSYQSIYTTTTIKGITTSTEGWTAKNVEANIEGDKITITGATTGVSGQGTRLNGTWEITNIISPTEFEFIIKDPIQSSVIMTTSIGNTTRIIKEKLAEQVTIFEPNSDNFRSIWFPKSGTALERYVTFDSNLMPTVRYANNLVLTLCKALNIDWRGYETFAGFVSNSTNFMSILGRQNLLNLISSNSDFINEFINSRSDLHIENPIMTSNTVPTGYTVGGISRLSGTDYYYAFDNNLDTAWQSNDLTTNQYLQIAFPTNVQLYPYSFTIYTKTLNLSPKNIKLEYQDQFNNWIEVGNFTLANDTVEDTFFIFKEGISSNTWRFTFVDCYSTTRMAVNNIKIRGWNTYGL